MHERVELVESLLVSFALLVVGKMGRDSVSSLACASTSLVSLV